MIYNPDASAGWVDLAKRGDWRTSRLEGKKNACKAEMNPDSVEGRIFHETVHTITEHDLPGKNTEADYGVGGPQEFARRSLDWLAMGPSIGRGSFMPAKARTG